MFDIKKYVQQQLNQEQFDAAMHIQTSSLILAWAGSGKTRTLTHKIAYLIFWCSISPSRIFAVTFTNKAARELKERLLDISEFIQEQQSHNQDISLDDIFSWNHQQSHVQVTPQSFQWIGTFHALFLKFLKEELVSADIGYQKNFVVYDETESMSLIKEALKYHKMQDDVESKEAKSFISKMKWQGLTYERFKASVSSDYEQTMLMIYEYYDRNLKKNNALDFDDLLLLPYQIFSKKTEILHKRQKKFSYVMVDEAQDTNRIQFELMRMLTWDKGNITLIGDDYQSIYRWRWALMENFLNVKKYWSDIKLFKLETNYRSRAHIVHAGTHLIKKNMKQYEKNIKAHRESQEKIIVFWHKDELDEAYNTIDFIKKLHQEKQKKRWDIAILYRMNAQSAPFEQMLLQERVPYKVFWWFKFFERKEVKDVLSYVKYLLNPDDNVAFKRIVNTPKRKIWPDTVEKLEEYSNTHMMSIHQMLDNIERLPIILRPSVLQALKNFTTTMKFISLQSESMTPAQTIKTIVDSIRYRDYLIASEWSEAGEEKFENIGQLINMADNVDYTLAQDTEWSSLGKNALKHFIDEVSLMSDLEEQQNWELDVVKLMTVHSSKWLEFPVVFIVWLEENIFPLSRSKFDHDELEEERRLMYVAVTRAKDHLFLSYASSRKQWWNISYNAPSRFIEEIPDDLKKMYILSESKQLSWPSLEEWDIVRHSLFWLWEVVEVRKDIAIVKFQNAKFSLRKVEIRALKKV